MENENLKDEQAKDNIVKPDVSGMLPLAEVEKFIWETAEDYHLWDEETEGQYPVKRMIDAMSKWWAVVSKR
jgi:adenosylmethionine-8-amino-7-oxononanoate aminotransferase